MTTLYNTPNHPQFEKIEPVLQPVSFDPAKHLCFQPPTGVYTLKDLQISEESGISPIAITQPFPLFSPDGVRQLRKDLFRKEILDYYQWPVSDKVCKLRGFGKKAPFVYDAWQSEHVRKACSIAAGVELEVVFEYEIAHTNVQIDDSPASTFYNIPNVPPKAQNTQQHDVLDDYVDPIVSWHKDSYPFVCVVMLSDSRAMVGGETALRKGDGQILKVRGPSAGYGVMLQGAAVEHVALKAMGAGERITIVTSFRPKSVQADDTSSLRTVKKVSNLGELFKQWSSYRLDIISQRATAMKQELQDEKLSKDQIIERMKEWTEVQMAYLQNTITQMTT